MSVYMFVYMCTEVIISLQEALPSSVLSLSALFIWAFSIFFVVKLLG